MRLVVEPCRLCPPRGSSLRCCSAPHPAALSPSLQGWDTLPDTLSLRQSLFRLSVCPALAGAETLSPAQWVMS